MPSDSYFLKGSSPLPAAPSSSPFLHCLPLTDDRAQVRSVQNKNRHLDFYWVRLCPRIRLTAPPAPPLCDKSRYLDGITQLSFNYSFSCIVNCCFTDVSFAPVLPATFRVIEIT